MRFRELDHLLAACRGLGLEITNEIGQMVADTQADASQLAGAAYVARLNEAERQAVRAQIGRVPHTLAIGQDATSGEYTIGMDVYGPAARPMLDKLGGVNFDRLAEEYQASIVTEQYVMDGYQVHRAIAEDGSIVLSAVQY